MNENVNKIGSGPARQPLTSSMRELISDMVADARGEGYDQGRADEAAGRFPALIVGLLLGAACAVPLVIIASHLLRGH